MVGKDKLQPLFREMAAQRHKQVHIPPTPPPPPPRPQQPPTTPQEAGEGEEMKRLLVAQENTIAALQAQLDELRGELEAEVNLKTNVQARLKATETELKHAHEAIEEEQEDKAELQKLLTAAKNDAAQQRANLDNEATPHID